MRAQEASLGSKIAASLLCGLAVFSIMMFATHDGETDQVIQQQLEIPKSVFSADVIKAATIYTATPKGQMSLLSYFKKVEGDLLQEKTERIEDVKKIQSMMAKNAAINHRARAQMKKRLMATINTNESRSRTDLQKEMRRSQERFAKAAEVANRRKGEHSKQMKSMRSQILADKRAAAASLAAAVVAQQRAVDAQSAVLNAKIRRTNKQVSANSVMMRKNARDARHRLTGIMRKFNHKLAHFKTEAQKRNSKLAAQLIVQDRKTRQWANAKVAAVVASTASKFQNVRSRMQRDRKRADNLVQRSSKKLTAALSAQAALQNKRFKQTVKNIAAAQSQSTRKLNAAKASIKVSLMLLTSVVRKQETKMSNSIAVLAGKVESNRKAQAKVNSKVSAETRRLLALGTSREIARLKTNRRLSAVMKANAVSTRRYMSRMSASFTLSVDKLRKQAARDRAVAAFKLKSATSGLYQAIARNQAAQRVKNTQMSATTEAARRDAANALRNAKNQFRSGMQKLIRKAAAVERKQSKAYRKLTGVVSSAAAKSAAGRKLLRMRQKAQENELRGAINNAIVAGEQRSGKLVLKMKQLNKATRAALNSKISAEIGRAKRWASKSLEAARMESRRERTALKRQLMSSISAAKQAAKKNLKVTMAEVNNQLARAAKLAEQRASASAQARASLTRQIALNKKQAARRLTRAVAGLNRARLAYQDRTNKKLHKASSQIFETANKLTKSIKTVERKMQTTYTVLRATMTGQQRALNKSLQQVKMQSMTRAKKMMKWQRDTLAQAKRRVDQQIKGVYGALAAQRKRADAKLSSNVYTMNAALAKQAALNDARFGKMVKNIDSAKREAASQVAAASRTFRTAIVSVTAIAKNVRTRLQGEINVVAGKLRTNIRQQAILNRKVSKEMAGIVDKSNVRWSQAKRARGKLRDLLAKQKTDAARMVNVLARRTTAQLVKVRRQAANFRRTAATDLTRATKKLFIAIAKNMKAASKANTALKGELRIHRLEAMTKVLAQRKDFQGKLRNLANTVTANAGTQSRALARLTGVVQKNAARSKKERAALRDQQRAMKADLKKAVARAIQIGQAKAAQAAASIAKKLKKANSVMKEEMMISIEKSADSTFATLNSNRMKIADNYLALKAYCVASKLKWRRYRGKVNIGNLLSIGDVCVSIGELGSVVRSAPGITMGRKSIAAPFSGKRVSGGAAKRINGLVNEYTQTITTVRNRWPFGLGKYLLIQVQSAMQNKGCLEVSQIRGTNQVFVNARSVGFTSRLNDFRSLSVDMKTYESTIAQLTAQLATKRKRVGNVQAKPPQWQGN